jgi:hypothetical protein
MEIGGRCVCVHLNGADCTYQGFMISFKTNDNKNRTRESTSLVRDDTNFTVFDR